MTNMKKNVSFCFYCQEKESVDLKIRLKYDGLKQNEFFSSLLKMYITQDPLMLQIVQNIKEKKRIMGKNKLKNTAKDYEFAENFLKDIGITDSEKENIFDIIEMDIEEYE